MNNKLTDDVFPLDSANRPPITTTYEPEAKRCRHCGWPCFSNGSLRTPQGSGVAVTITENTDDVNDVHYEPVVDSGCPFCGNRNWKK